MSKPIPVISVAVISSSYWVQRLIASIDYPVDNFIIYNNSVNEEITQNLENIVKITHPYIKKFALISFPSNMGLCATWNITIKCYMNSPYWFFVNDDVAFTPGFCAEIAKQNEDAEVGIVHGGPGDFNDGAWDVFTIKDWVIQSHGMFDENFYPGYGEDVDYIMRLHSHPVKRVPGIKIPYYHGLGFDYYETGMSTKRSNPELSEKLNFANFVNFEYLTKKWGPDWRNTQPWQFPFNSEMLPISYTTFDLEFCRKKYLGF